MDRYNVNYGDEMTEQPLSLVGEEVLDGVDCRIFEYSYRPPTWRVRGDRKTTLKLLGGKLWIGKQNQEWIRMEAYSELINTMRVTTVIANPYRISPPLWIGKSWSYESRTETIPEEFAPPSTSRYGAEVVCQEEVSVPAGTFTTYKVEFRLAATFGIELEAPILETIMWFEADTYCQIRRETYTVWEQPEFAELAAAEGLRKMGIVRAAAKSGNGHL